MSNLPSCWRSRWSLVIFIFLRNVRATLSLTLPSPLHYRHIGVMYLLGFSANNFAHGAHSRVGFVVDNHRRLKT